ncbi:hypothetical protein AB0J82_12280 [Asanoa sp. NPDC049518]|uniref:hypothetical protein n=1 Tax=unclassified Asanoa TaxID=2685164 RepID=UPI00342BB82E
MPTVKFDRSSDLTDARKLTAFVVGVASVALAVGFSTAKLGEDPHTAETETVTGIVTWSNDVSRLIAFEQDGAPRVPGGGDTIVSVFADSWYDAAGTSHSDGTYPTCLAGVGEDPVSMDRHRVELQVLHRAMAGGPSQLIAVQVHCLD